jgi:hypothetical protein
MLFRAQLSSNLFPAIMEEFPEAKVNEYVSEHMPHTRDRVYTPVHTLLTMLLSAVQEDKSFQHAVDLFNSAREAERVKLLREESEKLEAEKKTDMAVEVKKGRPKQYKSKLRKSKAKPLSDSTVAYNNARKRLPVGLIEEVFQETVGGGDLEGESWYGFRTYMTDGTYLQLQDTESIREVFPPVESNGMYPQGLLQILVRQGSGQIVRYALASRGESELKLVVPMIKGLKRDDLLLGDDLYNTYYNFCQAERQGVQMIVPGKRERNYRVVKIIAEGDEIVEIKKTSRLGM